MMNQFSFNSVFRAYEKWKTNSMLLTYLTK